MARILILCLALLLSTSLAFPKNNQNLANDEGKDETDRYRRVHCADHSRQCALQSGTRCLCHFSSEMAEIWSQCIQSFAGQVHLCIPNGFLNISVISQPKWLKFGLQAHFLKIFGHTKFQLPITFTFRVMKLLVEITKYLHYLSLIILKVKVMES